LTSEYKSNSTQRPTPPANAKKDMRAYGRLVMQALSHQRRQVFIQITITIMLAVVPAVQVVLIRYLFDSIMSALSGNGITRVAMFLTVQGVLTFATTLAANWKQKHLAWLNEHVTMLLKEPLLQKMQRLELTQFEQSRFYDAFVRAQAALNRGVRSVENVLLMLESFITTVSYAVVASRIHWSLPILLPVFALPSLFLGAALARRTVALNRGMTPLARATSYVENLLTSRSAAKEVRIYQTYRYFFERFRQFFWAGAGERQQVLKEQMRTSVKQTFIDQVLGIGITLFILWMTIRRRLSLGVYVALTQAIGGTQASVETFTQKFTELYTSSLQMADYFNYIALPEAPGSAEIGKPDVLPARIDTIEVNGLSFTYPGRPEPSLQEVSFQVNRGEIVAIIGENGSGKTTLAKCLLGLYTTQDGAIRYNGIDINSIERRHLYRRIAALFQDFVQYDLTARENIGLGDAARMNDDNTIWEAVHAAQLDGVFDHLPKGLETELGVMFGTGKELSMGQWQRLALARAFFKNADVILLDEPTASLDPQSELNLFQRVKDVYRKDRILFLISHRLGICREVDRILVLQNGRLVENGNHTSLMAQNGVYAKMYRMQADLYSGALDEVATASNFS
jgi:ATP-binding cassette subfamily B protein